MKTAMIPCAGFGTRMGALTADRPKPLLPVHGVPLLAYSLFLLHEWHVEHCVINLHYKGEQIQEYLRDFPFFRISFSEEKERILGTAGGIRYAMQTTGLQGPFLYMNPDTIFWPETRPDWPVATQAIQATAATERREAPPTGPLSAERFTVMVPSSSDLHLYLSAKEPGNTERGFQPRGDGVEDRFVPLSMGAGQYYYTGLSILHTDAVADLAVGEVAELRDTFQRISQEGDGLKGRLYRGGRFDCGTEQEFHALKRVDPVLPAWKDRWYTFLNAWPKGRL